MSFAKEVWETLSGVDCSGRIEKKMDLSYLSWSWAWATLMEHYPESEYTFEEDKAFPDGTVEVAVNITIREGDKSLSRRMWLPVMNHKNASVPNPSSRQRSDSRMRCLTKCLALFGLGHYIYAGEDLPSAEKDKQENRPYTDAQREAYMSFLDNDDATGFVAWLSSLPDETKIALHNSFDKKQITKGKALARELEAKGVSLWADIEQEVSDAIIEENGHDILVATNELNQLEKKYLAYRLGKEKMEKINALIQEAKAAA